MPGAGDVVGQDPGQVEAVEAVRLDPVVGDGAAQGRLHQEQQDHHREIEPQRPLARGEDPAGETPAGVGSFGVPAAPTQVLELSEDEQDQPQSPQQGDQAEGAPQVGGPGRQVSHQGFVGPIVGVGIGRAGPERHRRPGGPGEIVVQALNFAGVLDVVSRQPRRRLRPVEVVPPFTGLDAPGGRFRGREEEDFGPRLVAVLLQFQLQALADLQGLAQGQPAEGLAMAGLGQLIPADFRQAVEVLRRVVGPEIGAMTPQGSMLHEGVLEEHVLAMFDVGPGEQGSPLGVLDLGRNGGRPGIGFHRHHAQQPEAEDHHQQNRQLPEGGNVQLVV